MRTSRIALWSGVVTLLLLAGGSALHVWRLHDQDRRHVRQQAEQYAMVLEAHASQVVSSADMVLDGLMRYARAGAPLDADGLRERFAGSAGHEALSQRLDTAGSLYDLWVFDAAGLPLAHGRSPLPPPISIADRPTFRFHRDQPLHARTFVSAPFPDEFARFPAFQLTRPVVAEDGRFLGILVVQLSIDHFQRFYDALSHSPAVGTRSHLALGLVRGDGVVLARSPGEGTPVGMRVAATGPYAALARMTSPGWRAGQDVEYRPFTAWDGDADRPPEVVVRDLASYPLQVVVSVDPAVGRAALMRHVRQTGALALLCGLLVAGAFGSLVMSLRQRAHELHEMRRLRDAADAASRAKGDFLATVSHEIRTPLNGILGTAELLAREPLGDHARRLANTLQRSAQTLLALIGDVLDFAKIEAGRLEARVQPFEAAALLREVGELFEANAEAKGLALRVQAPERPVWVMGEGGHLRQALINLASNALKFTDAGEVTLRLEARAEDGQEALHFAVSDTGIGIPDAVRDRLFAPFSQLVSSPARAHGGTGLGLAISARLVQAMGGRIQLDSAPGRGSTFSFDVTLPAATAGPEPEEAVPTGARSPDPSARLVLVEDDPTNRLVVEAQLATMGLTCTMVDNGLDALALADGPPPDLVLLDCNLPGLSGYEVARRWRDVERQQGRPRVPLIALTADVTARNAAACREAGMDEVVAKPCGLEALRAVLARWVPAPGANG